jgi:hypothetical protein
MSEGEVRLPLEDYNNMRDELDQLRRTTRTHQEFMTRFRTSLGIIVGSCSEQGLNLSSILQYYKGMNFQLIEEIEVENLSEDDKFHYIIKIKTVEDETSTDSIINN